MKNEKFIPFQRKTFFLWIWFIFIVLLFYQVLSYAQNSQCVFYGTVQINGAFPPSEVQINLLKNNGSFVRTANYNSSNGNYGVNAFSSDGFNNGDTVAFQVILSGDTIRPKTYGDAPIYFGNVIPNPPILKNVNLFFLNKPLLISPPNNSINQPIALTLSWLRVLGASNYQLQVSKYQSFSPVVIDTIGLIDTSLNVGGLENSTKYYWRVKSRNVEGESDWSEVWNFTTIIEKPSVPNLVSPTNGSVGLVQPITLKWIKSLRAEKYRLLLSLDSLFTSVVIDDTTTDTLKILPLLNNLTKYYWKVSASNIGGISDWSTIWNFTTSPLPPETPVCILPANGAINQPLLLTLFWSKSDRAETYRLQLAKNNQFAPTIIDDSTLVDTSKQVTNLQQGTKYYWHVRAKNIAGSSPYSSTSTFTTILPAPDSLKISLTPQNKVQLNWRDNSSNETGFIIERKINATGTYIVIDSVSPDIITYLDTSVQAGFTYFFRVYAYTSATNSEYSNEVSITIVSVLLEFPLFPSKYFISQNYPNPFNSSTMFKFGLPNESKISLIIYNLLGEVIEVLLNETLSGGYYQINWNADKFTSGIYLCTFIADSKISNEVYRSVKKIILVK